MFRFQYTDHLLLLWGIPVLIALFLIAMWWRGQVVKRLGEQHLISQLMIGFSKYKHAVKFGLFLFGMAVLVIGYANPQWGAKTVQAKRAGIDIFLALDISQSMLAEDIRPNRMERARKFAQHFSKARLSDRVGIIVFAGQCILTNAAHKRQKCHQFIPQIRQSKYGTLARHGYRRRYSISG